MCNQSKVSDFSVCFVNQVCEMEILQQRDNDIDIDNEGSNKSDIFVLPPLLLYLVVKTSHVKLLLLKIIDVIGIKS